MDIEVMVSEQRTQRSSSFCHVVNNVSLRVIVHVRSYCRRQELAGFKVGTLSV